MFTTKPYSIKCISYENKNKRTTSVPLLGSKKLKAECSKACSEEIKANDDFVINDDFVVGESVLELFISRYSNCACVLCVCEELIASKIYICNFMINCQL